MNNVFQKAQIKSVFLDKAKLTRQEHKSLSNNTTSEQNLSEQNLRACIKIGARARVCVCVKGRCAWESTMQSRGLHATPGPKHERP